MWDRVDRGAIQTFPYSELQVLALCLVLVRGQNIQTLSSRSLGGYGTPDVFARRSALLGLSAGSTSRHPRRGGRVRSTVPAAKPRWPRRKPRLTRL